MKKKIDLLKMIIYKDEIKKMKLKKNNGYYIINKKIDRKPNSK